MKFLIFLLPFALVAKPSGMQTISGKVTCKEDAGTLVIESGKRAIVKWGEFSIGKGERVYFSMPDSKSAVLNRVSGGQSRLLGQLDSNGKVYLLNPKGVLIGKDAIINTASFVASSLDVLDQDFLRGEELLFSGDSKADIVNLGTISCLQGDVALIAHHVANRGKISGKFVGLASGPKILLKPEGNQRIFVKANGGDSIQHSGEIQALAAELRTGSVYDHAIGCSGKIEAMKREKRNGRVYLVSEHGKNNFDGEIVAKGGEVHILGDNIFLGDHANIDVSDIGSAGTVLVGGDYQGMNFDIPNSLDVTISSGATVKADGEQVGNGGKVIFWADRVMHHNGIVSARGGDEGGDGGFIEISGHQNLRDPHVQTDCRAPFGKFGTVLFDPVANVTISSAANSGMDTIPYAFSPTASPSAILNITTLTTALANSNVIVVSGSPATVTDVGSITLDATAPISWSSATTLTMVSTGFISIEANITNTSTASGFIAMDIRTDGTTVPSIGYDGIAIGAGITLSSQSGAITLTGIAANSGLSSGSNGVVFNSLSGITATTGDVTITGTGGPGISQNRGIIFKSGATGISTSDGNIKMTGTGRGSNDENHGIELIGGTYSCTGIGVVELIGNGAAGTTDNYGVLAETSNINTNSGLISITGTADPAVTSTDNVGVVFETNSAVQSTTGDITIIGSGTGGATRGVFMSQTTISSGAEIDITGSIGDSVGSGNVGIEIGLSSTLTVSGSSDLNLTGTSDGDGAGTSDLGILVGGSSVVQTTGAGNILFTGTGGPGTAINYGVEFESATILSSAASTGMITINGVAGDGISGTNHGVLLDLSTNITSFTGAIAISGNQTATPTTAGSFNLGVLMQNSSTVSSLGTGSTAATIAITGTGGSGTTENYGINVDSGATISSAAGDITLSGTGGAGTSTNNHGVLITGGASTTSISSSDTGTIAVTGIGGGTGGGTGTNRGIIMNGAGTADSAAVTSTSGSISITGTKGASTNVAISLNNGALVESTSSGDVTISTTGDLIVDTSDVEAAGLLTISAISSLGPNDAITFDTATITGSGGPMITGTKTGGTGSGLSATTSTLTFGASGTISGTGIDDDGIFFDSSSFTANAGSVNLTGVVNSSTIGNVSGVYFDSTSSVLGTGSIFVSGNFSSPVAGVSSLKGIFLDGATVTNSGSGTFSFSGTGGASGTSNCNGIQLSSATVTSTTGNLIFTGIAGNSTSANSNDGVELNGGSITTTSGNVTLNGNQSFQPSSAGGQCIGIFIGGNASITSLGSGRIRINGRGGAGTTSNFGVQVNTATIISNPAATGSIRIDGIGGNGTDENFAVFLDTDSVITSTSGNIVVNGNQTTTLPSGSGGNFMGVKLNNGASVSSLGNAGITMKGTGGNGSGDASIGVFFQDSFVSAASSGNVTLAGIGGSGTSSLQGVRIENSPVTLASGNLTINGTGGEGSSTDNHGIVVRSASVVSTTSGAINFVGRAATNSSTNEGVRIFNAGSSVITATGSISCTGFASGTSTTGVHVTDSGVVSSTGTAPITLQTFSDIIIDEGGTVTGGGGLLEVISDRDLIITGGTAGTTPSGIFLGSGNGRFIVARNLSVFGGSGAGSFAQIGALTDSSANLDFIRIGNRLLVDGISTNSYALIGHGDPTVGGAVFSGNILFREIRGETIVRGATTADVGTDGFAQIGHIDGAGATLSGDVKFLTKGSLFVLGGLATADAYARIGHGGQSGGGTFGASVMDLLIGRSIQLTSTTAEAQIVNPSPSSPLILVTDNLNPKPPDFGLAGITQAGTLTANGELRIYTVGRALNTITNPINGEVFTPPALQIDNPQEEFSIYFPNGDFSTASFRIYYKTPISVDFPSLSLYRLGVANAQLQDELPIFRYMRLPNYPEYHANFCGETAKGINCLNNLDPYGSFIFEDNVYWVGGR